MVKNVLLGAVLVAVLALSGCNNDEERLGYSDPIKIDAQGIVLNSIDDGIILEGIAPANGGNFTLVAHSISKKLDLSLQIDNVYQDANTKWNETDITGEPLFFGDWGEITYLKAGNPNEIQLTLNPNESSQRRTLDIDLLGCNERTIIKITQESE